MTMPGIVSVVSTTIIFFFFMSYEKSITFEELYKASKKCQKGVMWKESVQDFVRNRLSRILRLHNDLKNRKYSISKYHKFFVFEPKKREIVSTRFRDRVFQKSMCDNGVYAQLTKGFIYDSGACQIGKGTEFTRNRLKCHLTRYYRKHGRNGWVLKLDVKKFFPSIDHDELKKVVRKKITDDKFYREICRIIDSFENPGIGLGSQISQLVALAFLDSIDHFIKENLKIKYYIRYMDDMILIHNDKEYLKYCWNEIKNRINEKKLSLNKKSCLVPLTRGFVFMQRRYFFNNKNRIVILPVQNSIRRECRRMKGIKRLYDKGKMSADDVIAHFKTWFSTLKGTNCFLIKKRMMEKIRRL